MNKKIFFSYAWRDMGLAQRIDADLRNSGIKVWRDRVDSELVGNFREQYLKEIDNCSHFIFLDSENYRVHANWCKDEIRRFFKAKTKDPSKKLIVLLAKNVGDWRKNELFPKQNLYKYIDFSIADKDGCIYDNDGKYGKAMDELCRVFEKKYQPWIEQDCEQDLLDELKEYQKLSENDRLCIKNDYENIRHFKLLNHNTIESRIRNFIADCDELSFISFTPRMLLLDYLSARDKYQECYDILLTLIAKFPDEPRAYRWLGTTCCYLQKYEEALRYFDKSIELSNSLPQHKKQKTFLNKIILNKAMAYIAKKDYEKSIQTINLLEVDNLQEQEIYCYYYYQSFCYLALGSSVKNEISLREGIQKLPDSAELLEMLGHCYCQQKKYNQAIEMYNKAIEKSISISQQIDVYASLSQIYHLQGNYNEVLKIIETTKEYKKTFAKEPKANLAGCHIFR